MLQQLLQSHGLTSIESEVYSLLLEQGDRPASTIGKQLGVNRSSIYKSLEKLISQGLVSQINKQSISFFSANDPLPVLEKLRRSREQELLQINTLKLSLQLSRKKSTPTHKKAQAHYYSGHHNLNNLITRILQESTQQCRIFLSHNFYNHYQLLDFFPQLPNSSAEMIQVLSTKENYSKHAENFANSSPNLHYKTINPLFDLGVDLIICGDKFAIISLPEDFGILIESRLISHAQGKVFDFFWKIGRQAV